MPPYETVSTKIPADLKEKLRKHNIKPSAVMRRALEREVQRAEAANLDLRLEKIAPALDRIDLEAAVAGIRQDRDRP